MGYSSTIMSGVKIGDGAIIASKSVITKNVGPYTIVGGNPAQIIRKRFSEDIIEFLLELKWWNLSIERITENLSSIVAGDIESLKKLINSNEKITED